MRFIIILGTILMASAAMAQATTRPSRSEEPSTRPASLQVKLNSMMADCSRRLDFPERQVGYVMQQMAARAEQIRDIAAGFTDRQWTVFVSPVDARDGWADISLPVRQHGKNDLMLTSDERQNVSRLMRQYQDYLRQAQQHAGIAKKAKAEATRHYNAAESARRRASGVKNSNPQAAAGYEQQAAQEESQGGTAEATAKREFDSASDFQRSADGVNRDTEPLVATARTRKPASMITVSGVRSGGETRIEITSMKCVVKVADGSGLRDVPVESYNFAGHFNAGNDAAVVWLIQARAVGETASR